MIHKHSTRKVLRGLGMPWTRPGLSEMAPQAPGGRGAQAPTAPNTQSSTAMPVPHSPVLQPCGSLSVPHSCFLSLLLYFLLLFQHSSAGKLYLCLWPEPLTG